MGVKKSVLFAAAVLLSVEAAAPVFPISNEYLDARIATINANSGDIAKRLSKGRFTAGTSSGFRLLYGYPSAIWSSITTVKIEAPGNTLVIFGSGSGVFTQDPVDSYDVSNNTRNTCSWSVTGRGIEVAQSLKIVANPRTGERKDTLEIRYSVTNSNTFNARAGLRLLFDTQLGLNDNSPMTAAGVGRITHQSKWIGADVPDAWLSMDNTDNPQIKAEGYLRAPSATVPDMLIIGQWDNMKEDASLWDFTVLPTPITDTAVAVFWNPVTIAPGSGADFVTYYGLPDYSGAEMGITKTADKAQAAYGEIITYTIDFINSGGMNVGNFLLWDTIPWNSSFVAASPGYSTTTVSGLVFWDLSASPYVPGASGSVWFSVSLTARTGLEVLNRAASSYIDDYWKDKEVRNSNLVNTGILTATITPTHTITRTHTVTPTSTITPTSTNTPVPLELEFDGVYPNPAHHTAQFVFMLSRQADLELKVYTVSGELVTRIVSFREAGRQALAWNCDNYKGEKVSSGVYLFMIEAVTDRDERLQARGRLAVVR
ncbi:MAG TPA: FlgD immunoglobulin-like domain containing protein [Candidatus Goldiibacteriota bacterium]|nr:FlgD immunoglobulin-like domain containing protein [Candidatus Goldiibacteriota bacterium]